MKQQQFSFPLEFQLIVIADPWALNVFDAGMRKLAFTVIVTRKDGGPLEKKKRLRR